MIEDQYMTILRQRPHKLFERRKNLSNDTIEFFCRTFEHCVSKPQEVKTATLTGDLIVA